MHKLQFCFKLFRFLRTLYHNNKTEQKVRIYPAQLVSVLCMRHVLAHDIFFLFSLKFDLLKPAETL